MNQKRPITVEDLYAMQLISNPQISPDGEWVVFALQRVDKKTEKKYSNLWLAASDGSSARQFTYGDQQDRQPQWSPDGGQIAFISNRQNSDHRQFFLIPLNGGEARPLITDLKGRIGHYRWSPDGGRLVFTFQKKDAEAIERDADEQKKELGVVARHITRLSYKLDAEGFLPQERWHLWMVDTHTGQASQLTDSAIYDELDPSWSPDGRQILFRANRSEDPDLDWDRHDLYTIPAEGGEMQKIETPPGPKSEPVFSPDGRWIAYFSHGDRRAIWQQAQLCLVPATGGPAKNLTASFDFDASHCTLNDSSDGEQQTPPTWSTDSRWLYFQVSHHGSTVLKAVTVEGTDLQDVIGPGRTVGLYSFNQQQSKLAYLQVTIDKPGQVWVKDMATGQARAITQANQDLFETLDLGQIEEVWYKGPDGNDLQGWILKPPDFNPTQTYPVILEIHGGPLAQYGYAFMHEFYFLAAQGYVVVYTNPRGGQGYGAEHARAIYNNWGSADFADVMAWADYVESLPYVDQTRMGVTGGSYGGYMTNWIISHTNRFKAAVTQRSVSNFVSMLGSSDLNARFQALFGAEAPPWEDVDTYWRQSPLKYFANVKTPTLVIHSEQDLRCDIEQGEQVYVALKMLGVETELVRFPGESHGLSRGGRTDRRIVRLNHILRWFDKHLK